jgi:amphi-Trp domain-containing protein
MKEKHVTEVLIDYEEHQRLNEFADMLESIAKKLKEDKQFTFLHNEEEIIIAPSEQVEAEYKYTIKGAKHSFEIELDWRTDDKGSQSLNIK